MTSKMKSKLPDATTNIFTTVNTIAAKYHAINLGQGCPNFDCSERLIELVESALRLGRNQYPPMPGLAVLREAIAAKIESLYEVSYDPESEITITPGGHVALCCALNAIVHPGDEVILFEPAFDCFVPLIKLAGGVPVPIELTPPNYAIEWQEVEKLITDRTRAILINTPHNPSGTTLSKSDLERLEQIAQRHDLLVLSDEVYEHITFDGEQHQSVMRFPELRTRSFVIFSFGKVFHTTGWKIGYCVAPRDLMSEFRKIFQMSVFCTNGPMQQAIAQYVKEPETYLELPEFYQHKRDVFLEGLRNSRFEFTPASGTYFQAMSYRNIIDLPELEAVEHFCRETQVAAIPLAPFYTSGANHWMLRFCFAKTDDVLHAAVERLCRV